MNTGQVCPSLDDSSEGWTYRALARTYRPSAGATTHPARVLPPSSHATAAPAPLQCSCATTRIHTHHAPSSDPETTTTTPILRSRIRRSRSSCTSRPSGGGAGAVVRLERRGAKNMMVRRGRGATCLSLSGACAQTVSALRGRARVRARYDEGSSRSLWSSPCISPSLSPAHHYALPSALVGSRAIHLRRFCLLDVRVARNS